MMQRIDLNPASEDSFSSLSPQSYRENWPQYILRLEDVYIGDGGAIYNANGSLNKHANFNYNFWKYLRNVERRPNNTRESKEMTAKIDLNKFKIKTLNEKTNYVYGHHYFNIYVFGHIWDTFQDLSKIETLNLQNKVLITPKITNHVKDLDLHFKLLGYPKENRISLDLPTNPPRNTLYKVPRLYYPSPTTYPSQVSKAGLQYLRSKYYTLSSDYPPQTKLYLQRPHRKQRIVTNEKEVVESLKKQGFRILNGSEGIEEHVRLFRNASVVIGAHGSLFRNMVFGEKSPTVYEFCPENRTDHNFEGIGQTLGIKYNWIKTPADKAFNITIDLNYLKRLNLHEA